jgi:hypothetical protein
MDGRSGLNMAAGSSTRRVLRKFFIVTIFRKRYVPNRRVGSYQVGTYRSTFAVISLWGKFGGLHACGDTFPHMVPQPNIFLTLLCSIQRLKRKDFQEIARLAWAQEASGSNPDAPTKISCVFSLTYQKHSSPTTSLWNSARQEVWIRKSFNFRDFIAR